MHLCIKTFTNVELSDNEVKEVVIAYLKNEVLGEGCYITKEGLLEHWTSWPHGSGTTTQKGVASKDQKAAVRLLKSLK